MFKPWMLIIVSVSILTACSSDSSKYEGSFFFVVAIPDVDKEITLKKRGDYTYNYTVDWGDGATDSNVSVDKTHTYSSPGEYEIKITGAFPALYFSYNDCYIKDVTAWGNQRWKTMALAFNSCEQLTKFTATDSPDLSKVKDMSGMFMDAEAFNGDLSSWDVSNVTNMFSMFSHAKAFNQDLSSWDVSNVTDMRHMFFQASVFNGDISSWDVSNVTDMSDMFYGASAFSNHDLSGWNVSNVTSYSGFSSGWGSNNTAPNFQ